MEIPTARKLKVRGKRGHIEQVSGSKLHFYNKPPTGNISLVEFQGCAIERLQILKVFENVITQKLSSYSEEFNIEISKQIRNIGGPVSRSITRILCDQADLDKDVLSHYILRLAYCHTDELRKWFITQEIALFRYRFQIDNKVFIQKFMEDEKLHYDLTTEPEKDRLRKYLVACGIGGILIDHMDFYKVPFYFVPELLKNRKCFFEKGFAYIPYKDIATLVINDYRPRLSKALSIAHRMLPYLQDDKRLRSMLRGLSKYYVGDDYSKLSSKELSAAHIPKLVMNSFPLCMQNLNAILNNNHHLKHFARMQYGLFLKGIGLPLEESLRFWRSSFTKIMDVDKFDKQYAYNIRHNYGKEGKRTNYTPYNCMKIITSSVSSGECHGCPFKHNDSDQVVRLLKQRNIPEKNIKEIMGLTKAGHFQLACGKVFMSQHSQAVVDFSPNHPNEYFKTSRAILESKTSDKLAPVVVKIEPIEKNISYVEPAKKTTNDEISPIMSPMVSNLKINDIQVGFHQSGYTHRKPVAGGYVAPVKQNLPHRDRSIKSPATVSADHSMPPPQVPSPRNNIRIIKAPVIVKATPKEVKKVVTEIDMMDDDDDFSLDDLNYIEKLN